MSSKLLSNSAEWGVLAIIFAVAGDLAATALLGLVDLRSGVELAVITVFVYTGIRVAPLMSRLIVK